MAISADLMHNVLQAFAKPGIITTRRYSQDSPAAGLQKAYEAIGGIWNGVCHALVRRWIVAHAYDIDFWHLMDGTNALAKFIAVSHVAREHLKYTKSHKHYDDKTINWFKKRRLVPRDAIKTNQWNQYDQNVDALSSAYTTGQEMANHIAPANDGGTGWYTTISMSGVKGHSVAAFLSEDVLFFDPNYGEFWFQSRELFRTWFKQFYNASGYFKDYPSHFQIRQYGKPWGDRPPPKQDGLDMNSTEDLIS